MDRATILRDIGTRLRVSLQATDRPYAEIARRCGVGPSRLGNWMRGDSPPDLVFLVKLARFYRINLDYILLGTAVQGARIPVPSRAAPAAASSAVGSARWWKDRGS